MAAASSTEKKATLRILVDENKNKVLYAEAGKDIVDALVSFLTLPLGTIARIVSNDSDKEKVSVGCLSSLYQSVANLDVKHFSSDIFKEMVLRPRNSSEVYCQNMKLNIDNTEKTKYFVCADLDCSLRTSGRLLSLFRNQTCKCGKLMNLEILPKFFNSEGFVHNSSTFTIFDDLKMIPDNFHRSVSEESQPKNFGMENFSSTKIVTVSVTQKEIVDLLKISLLSNTSLTDFFLRREVFYQNISLNKGTTVFNNVKAEPCNGEMFCSLKIVWRKSDNKILFALADDDFIDILLTFLIFPLGGVEYMLNGNSCLGSIDNLYKSVVDLDCKKYLKSLDLKDNLVKSRVAQYFKLKNQILTIDEVPVVKYSFCLERSSSADDICNLQDNGIYYSGMTCEDLISVKPRSSTINHSSSSGIGFVNCPSLYMVNNDLVVTPCSSMSVLSFLIEAGISSSELDEKIISVGKIEVNHFIEM
ncbi:unnamed protein product [Lupinus luteus]|uniref:DUF674 family protein n=1 Tax=Lupinus luteus TaxID=3873 RepID=A0AAV1W097_LUPLU